MSMKKTLLAVAATATLLSTQALAQRTTDPVVIQQATFQGSTYFLLSESSWPNAERIAISLGGHIATVESLAENAFIFDAFSPTASALATNGTVAIWIGLNDATAEGTYQWASGASSSYRNWNPGQPENSHADEDYAAIIVRGFGTPGLWHDVVLDTRFNDRTFAVVEVPEPATWILFSAGLCLFGARSLRSNSQRQGV
jgi:Lectin C-type domain